MIFIPMKYHSIYYDECDKNSTIVVCNKCKRSFYVPKDVVDNLIKVKFSKSSEPELICENCATELENNGKLKITKKSSSNEVETTLDLLSDNLDDLCDAFQDISNVFEEMSLIIKENLG